MIPAFHQMESKITKCGDLLYNFVNTVHTFGGFFYHFVSLPTDPNDESYRVGPNTMFRIASVSKAITSATIMTMMLKGEI